MTVKHPDSIMVWGVISGSGPGGIYFLPKNETMRGSNYLEELDHHMLDATVQSLGPRASLV